jgi:hypothetical protein
MRFRKIALALFACMALGAVAANAAQAAQWTLGTTENQTTAGTKIVKESVRCEKHKTATTAAPNFDLAGTVLGVEVTLTATQIDCVEASIDSTAGGVAHSEGKLRFTGVSVDKPALCTIAAELTTNKLTDEVITDPTSSAVIADRFFTDKNAGGEVEPFIELEFGGAECTIAGIKVPVKGSACGESVHTNADKATYSPNANGTLTKSQILNFGMAQQTTFTSAAAPCKLELGKGEATFTGVVTNELSGTNAGKPFGADAP